ncbi:MAG: hypothetical protein B7Z29_15810 [Hyphomicrobium sp. 12-62-95]|jgi:hypothetical protein|nr:MAG: hypothetical protein B7Z29_15810 [Hyphomicrobium sp. 12-62-95]
MKVSTLAALLLAASTSLAFADGGLTSKVQMDHPGVVSNGATLNPTAKPDDRSLTAKAMKDHPGVRG